MLNMLMLMLMLVLMPLEVLILMIMLMHMLPFVVVCFLAFLVLQMMPVFVAVLTVHVLVSTAGPETSSSAFAPSPMRGVGRGWGGDRARHDGRRSSRSNGPPLVRIRKISSELYHITSYHGICYNHCFCVVSSLAIHAIVFFWGAHRTGCRCG